MASEWVRTIRDMAAAFDIPFFFKQWGEWAPPAQVPEWEKYLVSEKNRHTIATEAVDGQAEEPIYRFGKGRAGRLLDGVEHNAMPRPLL